jgi:hypothetical protein
MKLVGLRCLRVISTIQPENAGRQREIWEIRWESGKNTLGYLQCLKVVLNAS